MKLTGYKNKTDFINKTSRKRIITSDTTCYDLSRVGGLNNKNRSK